MSIGIGVALESATVRAASLERTREGLRLLSIEEQSFDPSQADALTRALVSVRHSLRIRQPVFLGLPSSAALVAELHPLVVNQSRAELAVAFELQQQLPFKISDSVWHHQWLLPINGQPQPLARPPRQLIQSARRLPDITALVAAVKQDVLNERLLACRRAGLDVGGVCAGPVAIVNACLLQRFAARSKTLTVLRIIDEVSAEWILWAPEKFQTIPILAQSAQELPQAVERSWQSIRIQWPDVPAALCVVGPTAAVEAASVALSSSGSVQIMRFDPVQVAALRSVRPEAAQRAVCAIGLALQAINVARFPMNLLSSFQRSRSLQRMRRLGMGVSFLSACLILAFGVSGMLAVQNQKARTLRQLQARQQRYQQLRPELRSMLQRQERLEHLIGQLRGLAAGSTAVAQMLSRVGEALPETAWLTRIEATQNGALDMVLEGRATSFQEVTTLIDALKALEGVTNVKPLSSSVVPADASGKESVHFAVEVQRGGSL